MNTAQKLVLAWTPENPKFNIPPHRQMGTPPRNRKFPSRASNPMLERRLPLPTKRVTRWVENAKGEITGVRLVKFAGFRP